MAPHTFHSVLAVYMFIVKLHNHNSNTKIDRQKSKNIPKPILQNVNRQFPVTKEG